MTVNYANRRGSEVRMFKYLHQTHPGHRFNFVSGNPIKHLYLIDSTNRDRALEFPDSHRRVVERMQ
jgi:hypothetical protein